MADKSVGELIAAQSVTPTDLFVLEQNGTAKKLTGQILENWLVSFADGHGGIQSIAKLSTSVLVDTYRITLADTTVFDFTVTNGKSITGISKTGTSGLVDTYKISYNDGSSQTYTVTNGAKGDKGDNAYVWIKYASQEPTESSHSMGDLPDDWIGIYSGNASTAPTDWKQYKWYQIKGEKGDTGNPATILSRSVTYQVGDSGTVVPSGSWLADVPSVPQGKYLWTRTVVQFNTGDPITWYSVAYSGINGTGAVSTVAGISPDETGNVSLTAENVGARPNTWVPTASDVGAIANASNSVAESNIANGAITRAKLANDALYSPVVYQNGSLTLTNSEAGKTVSLNESGADIVVTISKANSDAIPTGAEFAFLFYNGSSVKLTFSGGLYVLVAGESARILNGSVKMAEKYSMCALKKVASNEWLVTGNVEVVS